MTKSPLPLVIENLVKDYGPLRAVNEVSFNVLPGEVFGLLGPNGAGKTSIISIINTLIQPTQGTASVFGYNVIHNPKNAKTRTGCVPQELISHGFFTVEEILHIQSGYYGLNKNQKRIDYLLNRLGLEKHRNKSVKQLSGGMKRRLLIAKALVHNPNLVLLDEPTAGVDIELRHNLWSFVRELREEGVSFLLTTHYLEEAEQMCDRIGILDHGVLKMVGDTEQLIRKWTWRDVMILLKEAIPPLQHPSLIEQNTNQLVFRLPAKENVGDLIASIPLALDKIHDVQIREGKLEDLFEKITNGELK